MSAMLARRAMLRRSAARALSSKTVAMPVGLTASTPLLESLPLSAASGTKVFLKMETNQPPALQGPWHGIHVCFAEGAWRDVAHLLIGWQRRPRRRRHGPSPRHDRQGDCAHHDEADHA